MPHCPSPPACSHGFPIAGKGRGRAGGFTSANDELVAPVARAQGWDQNVCVRRLPLNHHHTLQARHTHNTHCPPKSLLVRSRQAGSRQSNAEHPCAPDQVSSTCRQATHLFPGALFCSERRNPAILRKRNGATRGRRVSRKTQPCQPIGSACTRTSTTAGRVRARHARSELAVRRLEWEATGDMQQRPQCADATRRRILRLVDSHRALAHWGARRPQPHNTRGRVRTWFNARRWAKPRRKCMHPCVLHTLQCGMRLGSGVTQTSSRSNSAPGPSHAVMVLCASPAHTFNPGARPPLRRYDPSGISLPPQSPRLSNTQYHPASDAD